MEKSVNSIRKQFKYGGHDVVIETGKIARQATAAVVVTMAETTVLVAVVGRRPHSNVCRRLGVCITTDSASAVVVVARARYPSRYPGERYGASLCVRSRRLLDVDGAPARRKWAG